jgi:hypothetical protein
MLASTLEKYRVSTARKGKCSNPKRDGLIQIL